MARKLAAHEAAQKKAAKQKKRLLILAVPMLAALVYAVMTLMNLGSKPASPVSATPASASAPAGSVPTANAPVTPGVATAAIMPLRSFTLLGRRDPFHDHGPNPNAQASSGSSSSGAKSGGKSQTGKGNSSGGGSAAKPPAAPLTGAVISLNGDKISLAIGATFGHAPGLSGVSLFRLVKVTPKTALINVVGTKQQFTLHVGKPLTLEQYGGWTYTLILEPLGSPAPMTVQTTPTTTTGP
jgi:hypothetical protein